MPSPDKPSTQKQALVSALQWGLVQTFVLDTFGGPLRNYYRATTDAFLPPSWVTSIESAAPLGLLVGDIGGYRWVTSGRAATSTSAHHNRVVFIGTPLTEWALAIVPIVAFRWLLGDQLFSVSYLILPALTTVAIFVASCLLAHRVDTEWYHQHRTRLLSVVKGVFARMLLRVISLVVYGDYLTTTQANYSLSGGPGIVVAACFGAVAGYALTDPERGGDRSAEFVVLLIVSPLGSSLLTTLSMAALSAVGLSLFDFTPSFVFSLIPLIFALGTASYLTYDAQTAFYQRIVGR